MAVLLTAAMLLSACAGSDAVAERVMPEAGNVQTTAEPSATQQPKRSFEVIGSEIRDISVGSKTVVYDAADYYNPEWTAWAGNLTVEGDALFFTEGAVFSDGVSCICDTQDLGAAYAVVRTDIDGANRTVLVSKTVPTGYWDIALLGGRVFFVDGRDDSVTVGYVSRDGGEQGYLDIASAAGEGAVCANALLITADDGLAITADFVLADGTRLSRNLLVNEDLTVTVL